MRRIWKSGEYEEASSAMSKVFHALEVLVNTGAIDTLEYQMAMSNALALRMFITDKGTEEVEE